MSFPRTLENMNVLIPAYGRKVVKMAGILQQAVGPIDKEEGYSAEEIKKIEGVFEQLLEEVAHMGNHLEIYKSLMKSGKKRKEYPCTQASNAKILKTCMLEVVKKRMPSDGGVVEGGSDEEGVEVESDYLSKDDGVVDAVDSSDEDDVAASSGGGANRVTARNMGVSRTLAPRKQLYKGSRL
jgi:hypothetical protein